MKQLYKKCIYMYTQCMNTSCKFICIYEQCEYLYIHRQMHKSMHTSIHTHMHRCIHTYSSPEIHRNMVRVHFCCLDFQQMNKQKQMEYGLLIQVSKPLFSVTG